MKRLLSLVCVAMLTVVASAQITWNTKGGFGVATCYGGGDGSDIKPHFVGKAGAGFEYPLGSNWSLMPSLEIAWKGLKYDFSYGTGNVDLLYAQVPVVAAYRINLSDAWNITLKAGPYFALALHNHTGGEQANKFDTGLDLGIDFERHKFVFGVETELGFIPIINDGDGKSPYGKVKNLAFYATVGWKF